FNVETISPARNITLTVWDVGGQDHLRTLWHHYFDNVDGLVFVVDSTDKKRLHLAKAELEGIYQHDSMKNAPLVVISNKQDHSEALESSEIAEKLNLLSWPENTYYVVPACALTGDGLTEAFTMLAKMIRKQKKHNFLSSN
ncbi:unnamed protein product, partial [Didymodactylos carnosus]